MLDTASPMAYIPSQRMTPDDLRAELTVRGMTQMAAATALGVEQSTISKWLRGERKIPPMLTIAWKAITQPTAQDTRKTRRGRTRKTSTQKG